MKKINALLLGVTAVVLGGCFAGPQMRMTAPADSSTYNGITVHLHSIEEGDFGVSDAVVSEEDGATIGNLSELIVDSVPKMEYRIGPTDVVQVVVWEHPELTNPLGQTTQQAGLKVAPDGTLFFPYAGEIQAAGLTVQELRAEITKRLAEKALNNPQVDVSIIEYNNLKVFVTGEVKKPGYAYFSERPMTIPMAIAEVGGFSSIADPSGMQLRRNEKVYEINYLEAFKSNLPMDRLLMKPDDQLYVPSLSEIQKANRVYVMGEVQRTGLVDVVRGDLSLVEALSAAGGLQATNASSRSIYVIRNTSEKQIDVFHLNAKNAMALAMAERFDLKARDIVYVDASDLATWNRIISQILPSVQTVYYGVLTTRNIQVIGTSDWSR